MYPSYYTVSTDRVMENFDVNTTPLPNKIEITLMTDEILVVPKVDYEPHGSYHIQALLVEEGLYKMYVRLECGSVDYMTIKRDKLMKKAQTTAFYLESRRIVNNFEIPIVNNDNFRSKESIDNNYCSSTQAFHGRFHIDNSFNYYDDTQHDGDVDFTFQPYGCKLIDTSNSTELLSLLSNQHIIFLGDSTLEQVYRVYWSVCLDPTPSSMRTTLLNGKESVLNTKFLLIEFGCLSDGSISIGVMSVYHSCSMVVQLS